MQGVNHLPYSFAEKILIRSAGERLKALFTRLGEEALPLVRFAIVESTVHSGLADLLNALGTWDFPTQML